MFLEATVTYQLQIYEVLAAFFQSWLPSTLRFGASSTFGNKHNTRLSHSPQIC